MKKIGVFLMANLFLSLATAQPVACPSKASVLAETQAGEIVPGYLGGYETTYRSQYDTVDPWMINFSFLQSSSRAEANEVIKEALKSIISQPQPQPTHVPPPVNAWICSYSLEILLWLDKDNALPRPAACPQLKLAADQGHFEYGKDSNGNVIDAMLEDKFNRPEVWQLMVSLPSVESEQKAAESIRTLLNNITNQPQPEYSGGNYTWVCRYHPDVVAFETCSDCD